MKPKQRERELVHVWVIDIEVTLRGGARLKFTQDFRTYELNFPLPPGGEVQYVMTRFRKVLNHHVCPIPRSGTVNWPEALACMCLDWNLLECA